MITEGKFKAGANKPRPESSTRPPPKPANPKSVVEACDEVTKNVKVSSIINFRGYQPWYHKGNYTAHHTNGNGFVDYSDAEVFCKELPEIHVFMHDSGMCATHNMPCPVCKVNHAVFANGMFSPCWGCQEEGWVTTKMTKLERKWYEFWK